MVLRTVNLSDTIDQWKNQHNSLATDVGDLSLLNTTDSSSIVAAINSLIGEFDSANIVTLARSSLSGGTGITYSSSTGVITLSVPANTITFTMMADSAIGTSELRNNSVTFEKMADSAIGTSELRKNAVTYSKIQNIVTANRLLGSTSANGPVTEVQIQTAMYATGSVDSAALGSLSVATAKLQNNAVTFDKMADSSVGSNELRQAVQLIIYNSAGSAVKSLYGAGE